MDLGFHNREASIRSAQKTLMDRLKDIIPELLDETCVPAEFQTPNVFMELNYNAILPNGKADIELIITDNLASHFKDSRFELSEDRISEITSTMACAEGVIMRARYDWNGNDGKGLRLGRFSNDIGFSCNEHTQAFESALNCLCQNYL